MAGLRDFVPVMNTLLKLSEKVLPNLAQEPLQREEPHNHNKTPHAAITLSNSKIISLPSARFPSTPTKRTISSKEEEKEHSDTSSMESSSWTKIGPCCNVDTNPGLSVPTSKEDAQYEKARHRYKAKQRSPENDVVTAGRECGARLGFAKGNCKEKSSLSKHFAPAPDSAHVIWASESEVGTRERKSDRGFDAAQVNLANRGVNSSASSSGTMKPVRGARSGTSKDDHPFLTKPTRGFPAGPVYDGITPIKPISHLAFSDSQHTKLIIPSRSQDNTVSWRRACQPSTTSDDIMKQSKADAAGGSEKQKASQSTEATIEDENRRGKAPPQSSGRGRPVHSAKLGIDLITYRKRAQSLDSAKWSSSDSDGESSEELRNTRKFIDHVSQYAHRLKNDSDDNRDKNDLEYDSHEKKWRVPRVKPVAQKHEGQMKKEKPEPKPSHAYKPKSRKRNKQTNRDSNGESNFVHSVFKGVSEHKQRQRGKTDLEDEFLNSKAFDFDNDNEGFFREEYKFDEKKAKEKDEEEAREKAEEAKKKIPKATAGDADDYDDYFDAPG